MPMKSNAILRAKVWSEHKGVDYEVRIFKRPDGNFTRGNYDGDDVPDEKHTGDLTPIPAEDIDLVWKLITGEEADF